MKLAKMATTQNQHIYTKQGHS